jgi:uncharacterized protein (DUF433 family)
MTQTVEAVYDGAVLRPDTALGLAPNTRVRLTVERPGTVDGPLPLDVAPPPLRVEEGGVVRVGKSRISLDLVVEQYENGMAPEDMVRAYDTLVLADAYAVIAYYLRHRDEVRTYLKRRGEEAGTLRAKIEAERPRVSREELLARRGAREKDNAPTGQ